MDLKNYLKIKKKIPPNVNLLAVSKGFKSQEIKIIHNSGQIDFGESKFQEGFEKQKILKDLTDIKWHFIGRIQSNKIRKIVQNFDYIHSVDSYQKLEKISNIAYEENKKPIIMLQVKLSDDPNKVGFDPNLLLEKWKLLDICHFLNLSLLIILDDKKVDARWHLFSLLIKATPTNCFLSAFLDIIKK